MANVSHHQEIQYYQDRGQGYGQGQSYGQGQGQDLQQKGQEAIQSFKHFLHEKAPSSSNVVAFATVLPLGLFLLGLSGLVLFGSLIGLAVTTPVFVLFSPVIVPAILTIGLALVGFLSSGAVGITALSAFSWIINYLRGYHPGETGLGLGHATEWAYDKAGDMGHRVKEMGQSVTDKAR